MKRKTTPRPRERVGVNSSLFLMLVLSIASSTALGQATGSRYWSIGEKYVDHADPNNTVFQNLPVGDPQIIQKHITPGSPLYSQDLFVLMIENNITDNDLVYQGQPAKYAQNVAYDAEGNLKFFIVDGNVYLADGLLIGFGADNPVIVDGTGNFANLNSDMPILPEGSSEYVIIRDKNDCNIYYCYAATVYNPVSFMPPVDPDEPISEVIGEDYRLMYFKIDFTNCNNGIYTDRAGLISEIGEIGLVNSVGCMTMQMAPVYNPNDDTHYLFASNCINMGLINAFTTSLLPTSQLSIFNDYQDKTSSRAEAEAIVVGNKLLTASTLGVITNIPIGGGQHYGYGVVHITETDISSGMRLTGLPSSSAQDGRTYDLAIIDPSSADNLPYLGLSFYGIEFSPDGRYLYAASDIPPYLWYADLHDPIIANSNSGVDIGSGNYIIEYFGMLPIHSNLISASSAHAGHQQLEHINGRLYYNTGNESANFGRLAYMTDINNPTSTHQIVSNGFINGQAADITIPGTNFERSLYLLPDQIDNYDYHVVPDPQCCARTIAYDLCSFTVTAGQTITWNNTLSGTPSLIGNNRPVYVTGDIVIESGGTLFINDLTLKFDEQSRIIVQRGARLVVNNSTLTAVDCEGIMWRGMEVWGSQLTAHVGAVNPNYGSVRLNNSKIEHALMGIANAQYNYVTVTDPITGEDSEEPQLVQGSSGGLIQALNTQFLNNVADVDFGPHIALNFGLISGLTINYNADRSFFQNCTFETSQPLRIAQYETASRYHVKMDFVTGVNFRGNTFITSVPPGTAPYDDPAFRTTGILSSTAKFTATAQCSGILTPGQTCPPAQRTPNTFENLAYGINATSALPLFNFVATYNRFENTDKGIRMVNIDAAEIAHNEFNVGAFNLLPPGQPQFSYGIHQTNCSKYFLQNNSFNTNFAGEYGIYTVNSGEENNEIRNNTFDNLKYGATATATNFGFDPTLANAYLGLKYLCNDFNASQEVDVQVTSGGIAERQGECPQVAPSPTLNEKPANNTFSPVVPPLLHFTLDQMNVVQNTTYIYPTGNATSFVVQPANSTSGPYAESVCLNAVFTGKSAVCPDSDLPGASKGTLKGEIAIRRLLIQDELSKIDGGDTDGLLAAINGTMSPGQLKDLLLAASPYLSDAVLLAVIQRQPPLAPGLLKDILLANSPLSPQVQEAVTKITLPNGVRNQINAAQTGTSPMQQLRIDVSELEFEKDMYFDALFRRYLNDSLEVNGGDSLEVLLLTEKTLRNEMIRVSVKIMNADFAAAQQLIDSLKAVTSGYEEYLRLQERLIVIFDCIDKSHRVRTDSDTRQELEDIASGDPNRRECQGAASLLELFRLFNIPEKFEFIHPSNAKSMIALEEYTAPEKLQTFKVWPNPANGYLNVQAEEVHEQLEIVLTDITGRTVLHKRTTQADYFLLDVSGLAKGVYVLQLANKNGALHVEKLILD